MSAIFKREFKSYFTTPVGYIVLTVLWFFLGFFFTIFYAAGSPEISGIISASSIMVVFIIPILTMRLMSDDRRQKVDQVLLTSPVKLSGIVLGKFFAALAVYALGFAPTVIFEIIFASYVSVNVMSYLYALLGMLLLGGALIAIGIFISSLTESASVAAILSLCVNFLSLYITTLVSNITVPEGNEGFFGKIWEKIVGAFVLCLEKVAFIEASANFFENMFSIADIVYFLSIIAAFIFLSVRSLEKRRWS